MGSVWYPQCDKLKKNTLKDYLFYTVELYGGKTHHVLAVFTGLELLPFFRSHTFHYLCVNVNTPVQQHWEKEGSENSEVKKLRNVLWI